MVQANLFTRLQDGPYWRYITEPGRIISREKWWSILFMLDNKSEGVCINSFYQPMFIYLNCFLYF